MQGTIVIHAVAGQKLRRRLGVLSKADVLGCAGDFRAGDTVYVVVRGADGGQGVVATGLVACDALALPRVRLRRSGEDSAPVEGEEARVVIAAPDVRLLWPAGR